MHLHNDSQRHTRSQTALAIQKRGVKTRPLRPVVLGTAYFVDLACFAVVQVSELICHVWSVFLW